MGEEETEMWTRMNNNREMIDKCWEKTGKHLLKRLAHYGAKGFSFSEVKLYDR